MNKLIKITDKTDRKVIIVNIREYPKLPCVVFKKKKILYINDNYKNKNTTWGTL